MKLMVFCEWDDDEGRENGARPDHYTACIEHDPAKRPTWAHKGAPYQSPVRAALAAFEVLSVMRPRMANARNVARVMDDVELLEQDPDVGRSEVDLYAPEEDPWSEFNVVGTARKKEVAS